jgi:hypothetical protein
VVCVSLERKDEERERERERDRGKGSGAGQRNERNDEEPGKDVRKKKLEVNVEKTKTMVFNKCPHGCRRQCSEVAVPALVSSNLTDGGGFFPRKEPPPGHGCVCMSFRG